MGQIFFIANAILPRNDKMFITQENMLLPKPSAGIFYGGFIICADGDQLDLVFFQFGQQGLVIIELIHTVRAPVTTVEKYKDRLFPPEISQAYLFSIPTRQGK